MEDNDYEKNYHNLGHYNITKSQFVRECKESERRQKVAQENFMKLPIGRANYRFSLEYLPKQTSIHRTIIIDGANVMHSGALTLDTRYNDGRTLIPDVMALLALVRYFVWRDFEVIVVISSKYYLANVTNYKVAIDELVKNKLCTIAIPTNLDDVLALEIAAMMNGVVVSSDMFRDHQYDERYRNIVKRHWLGVDWKYVNEADRYKRTRDNNFMANKMFDFKTQENVVIRETSLINEILYTDPIRDVRYEVSQKHRNKNWTRARKNEVLEVINRLIVDGVELCPANERRIISEPIHEPMRQFSTDDDDDDGIDNGNQEEW